MIRMRTLFRLYIFSIMFICASVSVMAQSKIYYVSPTSKGTGDGSSWQSTMTLADALNTAKAGDQIWVQGFEQITDPNQLYVAPAEGFSVKSGVQLYGGFKGTERSADERETLGKPYQMKYRSVLSGDVENNDTIVDNTNLIFPANTTRQNNATHVLSVNMKPTSTSGNNNTYPTVINGFTIAGGQADGADEKGGGIYISGDNTGGGNFRIERCFLFNNYATQGGAVYVSSEVQNLNNGESLINQCVVYNNAAGERAAVENQGGGIYLAGKATVVNTSIFNNENGGLRISSGSKVVNSTIARNTGAGVDMTDENASGNVANSIVWGNSSLSLQYRPTFNHSAFHEVTVTNTDAGTDDNGNVYVAKENRDEASGPMFDAPSIKTSYDRDFNWRQTAYPLWSWNVLEGSVMIDKGNGDFYVLETYGNEDMAGKPRISGTSISIGAYEYQYLPASRIRYVKPTATGKGDGSSWENASADLQKMIDELADNNSQNQTGEVWVAAGTYTPQSQLISGTGYSASFRMRDGISVYGGFAGTEKSKLGRQKGTMPWDFTNPTVLEAAYYSHDDFKWTDKKWTLTSDSRHVVWFAPMPGESAFTNVTTLDGVTIQGGYAQGGTGKDDFMTDRGAGVYMDGANAYLSNCIVKENYATGNGGGVYLKNGRVMTSFIYNNNADADGGAVYVDDAGLVLRSMLSNNSAHNGAGAYLHNGTGNNGTGNDETGNDHPEYLILSTCVVSNNTMTGNGAVYCDKGGVLMQNTITNNNCVTATDATDPNASQTGGIYVDEYALVVNSVLWNNQMGVSPNGTNIPMYARNPSASTVRFLNNAISGVNNAVWNNTLQQQTLSLVDINAGNIDDDSSIGPRFTEPTTDMNFVLESNYGVQEGWEDGIISYYWKPVDGSNLWARGMALGQLPDEVVLAPELDIEGDVFAQKPAVGAFMVKAPTITPSFENDEYGNNKLVLYIDAECTEPSHDGSSWANAFRSLNNALAYCAALSSGDVVNGTHNLSEIDFFEIRVLEGDLWPRYAFTNNDPKTATVSVPAMASGKPVYIYGGYHRTTDNNTVVRDPLTYRSIINGNTEGKDITQGLYHCITVEQGANVVFDGFHVINGYAAGEASRQYGAGLLAHARSTVTVRNCIFENNTAQEGAAIDAREATLTMENCVVNNNTNTTETASVVNAQTLTMEHVTVVNNKGAAPANTNNLYESSFSAGNSSNNTKTLDSTGEAGAANFTNPTNAAGATLGFDTYLGGYSSFRPLTSSTEAGDNIINKAPAITPTLTSLTTDITVVNDRDLGGVPDLGAYEADLPKARRVIYVRQGGNGDGLSWGNAMGDINAAVKKGVEYNNKLSETDKYDVDKRAQVWVAAGTYKAEPGSGSDNCFEILEGVDVYGAFPKTGNPGINDRHPFISTSVYNNYDGIYKPEDYETILMPSSNSGNRRVLGQADTYNPINAVKGGNYVSVGAGNGNYIYQDKNEYKEVGAGEGDYVYSANGGEYVSAAPEYCNYLKVEEAGHYYKYFSDRDKELYYDYNRQNSKYLVKVGSPYGDYEILTTGSWWNSRNYYSQAEDGEYVEYREAGYYETNKEEGTEQSVGTILDVPTGTGNLMLTKQGYNQVGSGYGNYKYLTAGYHKVEQGQGDYIYKAANRFGVETIWDGFTLTDGYLDSNSLNYLGDNGKRNGGAGAAIFTNVVLRNCVVSGNTKTSTNTGQEIRGGGVYCDEGTLVNCYILKNTLGRSNQYTAYGGGCYMYRGTAYNCVISENQTIGQHGDGAGIFIENAAFYNNTIVKNTSTVTTRGNGGICIWTSGSSSQLTIYNCIVLGNSDMKGDMIGSGDIAVSSNGGYINCNYSITSKTTNASKYNGAVTYNNSVVKDTTIFASYYKGNYRLSTMDGANMGIDEPIVNGTTIRLSEYTDMDFTDRIKDCRVDAGAYERSNIDNTEAEVVGNTRIFYVTQNGSGTTSGNLLTNAACATKLQIILNAAGELKKNNPDLTVIVKVAGYSENGTGFVYHANTLSNENDPQSYSYVVPYGVILEGGYDENDTNWGDEGSRDIINNPTKLSAIYEGTETQLSVNGYHTVTFGEKPADWPTDAGDQQTIIDGVWLTDGSATSMAGAGNPNTRGGGAIVPSGAHVRNCVVMDCEAIEGGGLYLMPGATVSGTLVMNNSAEDGGGIYADNNDNKVDADSRAHILSCTIANNEASSTGGGLYMEDGAVMNVNTVVFGNKAGSDKNVSGVVNQPFEDSKLASVFNIARQNSFYPFNSSFVETQEMPSDFENRMLESDKSLYFADDYYRLKDYSLLIKHGLKNEYQIVKNEQGQIMSGLVATFNVAESDMQNIARVQTGNGAYRLDAGAFAYEGGILPEELFTRIFVSQTTNVTLTEGSMKDYLGRSFYTSFSTLEDALGYIRSMRGKGHNDNFEILVAGGTYKPSNERTTNADVTHDQRLYSFEVPQGVSIYGGFVGTEDYSSGGIISIPAEGGDLTVDNMGSISTILNARAYSDFNQNNILEPWELANQTILSGQINASPDAQRAYHVVFTDKGEATTINPVVLDGLTVMYGQTDDALSYAPNKDEQGRGGGIYSNGVTYTISRCRLLNNTAVRGGAVFVRNADLNLSGCILAGNKTVTNTDEGTTRLNSRGGAAYVSGIDKDVYLRAVNTLWANNESAEEGGAIGTNFADGLTTYHDPLLYIMNNTFVRNKAVTNPVIYAHNGKSHIVNTLIWGNVGETYQDLTDLSNIYDVSHCASDVDYVGKFAPTNKDKNIRLSTDNMNDEGPRFTNPSTTAGVAGNSASSLWNPAAISVVTDAGDGTEHTTLTYPGETGHTDNTTTGAYQSWFSNNGVDEVYIKEPYSRYSGPYGENGSPMCKPIDIGLYEYQYVSNFSTMPSIYVATLSAGNGSGDSWANATDDLRGAIVGAANPTQNTAERKIYVRDGNYSWGRLSAGSAYILNMSTSDNGLSKSLTLKGSCTGSGEQQDFSKPTVVRNDGSTGTLMSVSANTKAVTFEGFTFINNTTSGEGMNASTSTGSLTLKNCGFRISPTGLNISGNSGKMLIYNTLFADGGTGLNVESTSNFDNITLVNTTFANNSTADMPNGLTNVYNSVSWNNGANKMEGNDSEQESPYYNKVFSFNGDASVNNADIQKGPNFVDPLNDNKESRDYHIRPSVQLLNKGSNKNYIEHVVNVVSDADATEIPSTEVDLGNNARLVDNSIDIGAYEYEAPLQPIVYVKPDLTGTADGKSWKTALGDLQGAVDLAGLYAMNHSADGANGYVFVHGNYNGTDNLNITLGNTKIYGSMNDERSNNSLGDSYTKTEVEAIVSELLGKRKGVLESSARSSLTNVNIGTDAVGAVVDGFTVTGAATISNGALSTSIVENNVTGTADGLLYNSLVLGDGTADHTGSVSGVKTVNVTATGTITGAGGSGNNRELVAAADTNTYVAGPYWNYQLMETADDDIDKGADATTRPCIGLVGHSRDLIGNLRIRNTVDNGCFETWNIISDAQITADDKPVGKSVVYVRKGQELSIADDVYPDGNAFNPGFLLLQHQAGLRGNGNRISLTNLAVERDVAEGGNDLAAMPFKVTGISPDGTDGTNESYELMRYSGRKRAAYSYQYDGTDSEAWIKSSDQDFSNRGETEGFLIKNGNTAAPITVRFYGKSEISNVAVYKENGTDKSIELTKWNYNDSWTTDDPGTGNRFTHKENMSWNLFGSPYLCAMNYSDMEYGRVVYGYDANGYKTVNTANANVTEGHIPAGSAVFTQTATLRDEEIFTVKQPSGSKSGDAFAKKSPLSVAVYPTGTVTDNGITPDILQLDAVPASEARNEFDMSADGVKWMAGGEAQIYATRSGARYSLLSAVSIDGKVAVGVTVPEPGMYTIAVPDDCMVEDYETVVLEDAVTGRTVDLLEGGYDFTTVEEGDIIGRFNISFNRKADADGNIRAYFTADDMIRVEGVEPGDNISVYSVDGMRVASVTASSNVEDVRASVAVVAIVKAGGKTVKIRK